MALSSGPRTFEIDNTCTLDDLRQIVSQTQDAHGSSEVRVHVRMGNRNGAKIRTIKLLPPEGHPT